jgi:hypothetical protein
MGAASQPLPARVRATNMLELSQDAIDDIPHDVLSAVGLDGGVLLRIRRGAMPRSHELERLRRMSVRDTDHGGSG